MISLKIDSIHDCYGLISSPYFLFSLSKPFNNMEKRQLDVDIPTSPPHGTKRPKHQDDPTTSRPLTPSRVQQPATHVPLDGVLANVSPLKNKRFVGEIVDSTTSIRLVGFDPTTQQQLADLSKKQQPIHLTNCDVQLNTYSKHWKLL